MYEVGIDISKFTKFPVLNQGNGFYQLVIK